MSLGFILSFCNFSRMIAFGFPLDPGPIQFQVLGHLNSVRHGYNFMGWGRSLIPNMVILHNKLCSNVIILVASYNCCTFCFSFIPVTALFNFLLEFLNHALLKSMLVLKCLGNFQKQLLFISNLIPS